MLLHRLIEYADRVEGLPPPYYRSKKIQWVLLLPADDRPAALHDRRPAKGSKDQALVTDAPYAYRSGTMPPPNLLVDTAQFVLGVPKASPDGTVSEKAVTQAQGRHQEYIELLLAWAKNAPDDPAAQAAAAFVSAGGLSRVELPEGIASSDNVALMSHDNKWLHSLPLAQEVWAAQVRDRKAGSGTPGVCLICGCDGALLATIPESIKAGAIPTTGMGRDAQLVSINASAQGRGGVLQLVNTPVCERCGSRAMAALNVLLAERSHRRRTADSVTVWWTREESDSLLEDIGALDTPDPETVGKLLDSLHKDPGPATAERVDANAYYALTLSLNNARAVVTDWLDIPVERLRRNIAAWFEDHQVFDGWENAYRYRPLWHLALAAGRWDSKRSQYDARSTPHGLERELLHAALTRGPVPARLLPQLLQRIRADARLDIPRIALLRLALHPNRRNQELTGPMPRLDSNNDHPGYLCGRAFAVLEAIQRTALRDVNTTIGDKFLGTATTAPAAVLTNLRRGVTQGHLKRLKRENKGAHYALEARLTAAFSALAGIEGGIPALLNAEQQAWFILGYEQERAEDRAASAAHKAAKEQKQAAAMDTATTTGP
ncbi:type I-C CRISPR-associated protein Cas8c/Csd1 [Streptomyces sp. T-3]|nr:type I-C CRISPR-associated protein Cas8c/Csd1 [Streptomyces sp. T-3]